MRERGRHGRGTATPPVRRIAVFLQNRARLGTLICHLPLISSLKRHYAGAQLTVVAPFAEAELLVGEGLADARCAWPRGAWAQWRLVRRLAPDLALTLRPASMFIDLLVGTCGAPIRLGFATAISRRLFTAVAPRDLTIYRPLNYLRLVEPIGVPPLLSAHLEMLAHRAPPSIDPRGEHVCLMPGGAAPFKLWGIDNFLALAARLRADWPAARFVFVLGPGERALRPAIAASPLAAACTVLDTPALDVLAQAVSASRVTIAHDCGPSHVAQLLGVPYVGLFADHKGQASRIAAQWFLPRPRARWVSGPAHGPITALPVAQVHAAVRAVLVDAA
ncbi:MAG: glycosyltransferase family 9 protein [Candidatus Binatia bacterium]